MKKINLKSQKGVTLITLAVAVVVMAIIINIVLYNVRDHLSIQNLQALQNDIENLRDKVSEYYAQYGDIPTVGTVEYTNTTGLKNSGIISSAVDGEIFYVIKLSALENLTLSYGKDYKEIENPNNPTDSDKSKINSLTDIFIINSTSHNIFYVEGVKVDGEMYYTDYRPEEKDMTPIPTISTRITQKAFSIFG